MLGAIVGDVVGSIYEFSNIKTKSFPLFSDEGYYTDDTVLTIAVADAIMDNPVRPDFSGFLHKWGISYLHAGYGAGFFQWMLSQRRAPYNSWGNGSAMRVSPVAEYVYNKHTNGVEDKVLKLAAASAEVTHNHPEGVAGAQATALSQLYCQLYDVDEAKTRIVKNIPELFGYDLTQTLDEIRPTYEFNETCRDTVPQAIIAFLESTGFEDAIRNAISLGGDSDTLAAITGGIAQSAYGVPTDIQDKVLTYLTQEQRNVIDRWDSFLTNKGII